MSEKKEELKHWEVTVYIEHDSALTLGSNHMAGKTLTEADKRIIREAARRLLSFVGEEWGPG